MTPQTYETKLVPRELIGVDVERNARRTSYSTALAELETSIKDIGLLQPVGVRPYGEGRFLLVWGYRRLTVLDHMKTAMIPAVVVPVDEAKAYEMMLAENTHREDVAPWDIGAAVSGFYPMTPEIDVLPTLSWFAERGHPTALPVVVGRHLPLAFRAWSPGAPLERGALGIPFPAKGAAELIPEILLVPLLAFDRRGHRLGYGGGYYDRTLADLRAKGPVLAIGVGYSFQEVEEVPATAYDQRIDAIATESRAERLA